jgi:hypothetical protein
MVNVLQSQNITAAMQLLCQVIISRATKISGALYLIKYQLIGLIEFASDFRLPSLVFGLFLPQRQGEHEVAQS